MESQFSGKMYSDFKADLGNILAEFLSYGFITLVPLSVP